MNDLSQHHITINRKSCVNLEILYIFCHTKYSKMSNEPLTEASDPVLEVDIVDENLQIINGDHALTFDLSALTTNRQIIIPDSKSKPLSFNATSVSCGALPSGANNTFYGIGAGSDVTTGTGNTVIGYNAQAGSATAVNRVVLSGTGLYNNSTHIETSGVDIPNLQESAYDNVVFFDTVTGKLGQAPIAVLDEWANGTAASPAQRFASDTNTGFYLAAANTLGIAANGLVSATFSNSQALFLDGLVGTPSIGFLSDTNTGIYRVGADDFGFACGGVRSLRIGPAYVNIESTNIWQTAFNINNTTSTRQYGILNGGSANTTFATTDSAGINTMAIFVAGTGANVITQKWNENQCAVRVGTAALPSYSFYEDNNTGMYRSAADTVAWSTNGTLRLSLSTTTLTSTLPFYAPDGSHSAPSYTFSADTDLGFYRSATDEITFNIGLATNQYPLRLNISDNLMARRTSDAGDFFCMCNLQAYGAGFNDQVYYSFVQTTSTTGYNFALYVNNGGNAWRVRGDGATFADGAYSSGGADYAEWFESSDGKAIPVGSSVVLDGSTGKVRLAQPGEEEKILGIVRPKVNTNACVIIGNSAEDYWNQKFEKDEFGRFVYELVDYYKWVDEKGQHHGYYANQVPDDVKVPENKEVVSGNLMKKLHPDYDPSIPYVPRSERTEWHVIGMMGQIPVKNGQVLGSRWQLMRNINDGSIAKLYLVQ